MLHLTRARRRDGILVRIRRVGHGAPPRARARARVTISPNVWSVVRLPTSAHLTTHPTCGSHLWFPPAVPTCGSHLRSTGMCLSGRPHLRACVRYACMCALCVHVCVMRACVRYACIYPVAWTPPPIPPALDRHEPTAVHDGVCRAACCTSCSRRALLSQQTRSPRSLG